MKRRAFLHSAFGVAAAPGLGAAADPVRRGPALLAPDFTIVERAPSNAKLGNGFPETYFMAMGLVKLPSGRLVAGIPRGRRTREDLTGGLEAALICVSDDHGKSWKRTCELPYDSNEVAFFHHDKRLYQFVTPNRPEADRRSNFPRDKGGRIWVSASEDDGVTWTKPVEVFRGPHPYTGGQTSMLVRNGRLYWTVSDRYRELAAVSCDLTKGLLNPAAWRVTDLIDMPIPKELVAGKFADGSGMRCLEGNVVEVGGRMLVLARAVINRYATPNMAAVFEITDVADKLQLSFVQLYPLPGGQCKFHIVYDEPSRLYWMASNLPSNSQDLIHLGRTAAASKIHKRGSLRKDRRLLTLWYSLDSLNWVPAGWIARAVGWSQSFMYPSLVIDGDDLGVLSRTARDSGYYHDADLATYHVVKNFRELAFPLLPTF